MKPAAATQPADTKIVVDRVSKQFETGRGQTVTALAEASIAIGDREFVCLLGPSGCGKTTLLNIIAGFEEPSTGGCYLDGVAIHGAGPDRGMVFQEYGLYPWMTVLENVEFGLKVRKVPPAERRERCLHLLKQVRLEDFKDAYPGTLSGGMKQRVAICRVLAMDPSVLLMDEPFGALDALTRSRLQEELLQLWTQSKKTVVFVTHSVEEALYLSDRVVVMTHRPGRIKEIYTNDLPRPRDNTSETFNRLKRVITASVLEEMQ